MKPFLFLVAFAVIAFGFYTADPPTYATQTAVSNPAPVAIPAIAQQAPPPTPTEREKFWGNVPIPENHEQGNGGEYSTTVVYSSETGILTQEHYDEYIAGQAAVQNTAVNQNVNEGDCTVYEIYADAYKMPQADHGVARAVDFEAGAGTPVLSPISGVVTFNGMTPSNTENDPNLPVYQNSTITIENSCGSVTMKHGNWSAAVGQHVEMLSPVGTEGNIGYTLLWGEFCGTGSDCGYHTHVEAKDAAGNYISAYRAFLSGSLR